MLHLSVASSDMSVEIGPTFRPAVRSRPSFTASSALPSCTRRRGRAGCQISGRLAPPPALQQQQQSRAAGASGAGTYDVLGREQRHVGVLELEPAQVLGDVRHRPLGGRHGFGMGDELATARG